jgi:hypothetical protein
MTFSMKYYKNMTFFSLGWEPGFHRTGTCQWQVPVPGYEWHGEPYTLKILNLKRKIKNLGYSADA